MLVINRKYAIRKLVIGVVSLVIGLSATNSSYIHAKDIETIAKEVYKDGKVAAVENESVKISVVFNSGKPHIEVLAYKNVTDLVIELIDEEGKTYKNLIKKLKKDEITYAPLGEEEVKLSDDKSDRELLKFKGNLNGRSYDIKISYVVETKEKSDLKAVVTPEIRQSSSVASVTGESQGNSVVVNRVNTQISQVSYLPTVSETRIASKTEVVKESPVERVVTEAPATRIVTEAPVTRVVTEAPATRIITEAPATRVVTEAPATRIVTEAPVTRVVTEAPVTRIVTEAPVTRVVTEAPVTRIVTQQPEPIVISDDETTQVITPEPIVQIVTEAPATRIVVDAPVTRVVTDAPVTRIVTESPVTRVVTEAPATRIVTEAPVTRVVTEEPTTRIVTEEPITKVVTESTVPKVVTKGEALVEEEKPSIPIVMEKVVKPVVMEEKSSIPIVMEKVVKPVVMEEKPSIPIESKKGEALVEEEKPSIPIVMENAKTQLTLKELPTVEIREELEKVAFSEERVDDNSLLIGTEIVEHLGSDGTKKIVKFDGEIVAEEILEKPINKLIKIGVKKEKPSLSYKSINADNFSKELNVAYDLQDQHIAYIRSKLAIYDGDELVKEVDIDDLDSVLDELNYYDTSYRLVTTMTYDINDGNGPQEETLEDRNVEITLKKLEIKDVDSVSLYKHEGTKSNAVSTLSTIPVDMDKYFIRVSSERFKDRLLPVSKVEEVTDNGITYYKVTSDNADLVRDIDSTNISKYEDGFSFLVQKVDVSTDKDVYTSFGDLVKAVKENPNGVFKLGNELYAGDVELEVNQKSYLGDFAGTLVGMNKGVNHAIYGLKAPLFNKLTGIVRDLDLEDVSIKTNDILIGSLARETSHANISNVAVSGKIQGQRTIGGLVGRAIDSNIDNVSFEGNIYSTNNHYNVQTFVGGIVGVMTNGDLSRAIVDAELNVNAANNSQRAGGILGQANSSDKTSTISKVYSKGKLTNRSDRTDTSAGIVASIYPNANLREATSEMEVQGGMLLMADTNHAAAKVDNATVAAIEGVKASAENTWAEKISREEAARRIADYGITATTRDSLINTVNNSMKIDYTTLHKAKVDRAIAYLNIEKLMPFYNKEQIVKYGNLVEVTSKLFTDRLLSVTPMKGNEILSNLVKDKLVLDKLMLHYEDGTVAYVDVKYKEDFKDTSISEYNIEGTDLIYTPTQLSKDFSDVINTTKLELQSVKLKSEEVLNSMGLEIDNTEIDKFVADGLSKSAAKDKWISDKIDQLYLEDSFEKVKSEIDKHLVDILATDKLIADKTSVLNDHLVDYIKNNKERLLLGLSYMHRWYNINFDNFNFRELAMFHQDFFGKPVNTLEWLVSLAGSYNTLKPANNVQTYNSHIEGNTGISRQVDYLSKLRQIFLPNKTDTQWFKDNTKAYIVEQASKENPNIDVSYWQRVKDSIGTIPIDEANGLLPLLTADEGIIIITTMSSVGYSMYERYIDMSLKDTNPLEYEKQVSSLKELINSIAKAQGEHMDLWYRLVNDEAKKNLVRVIPIWDGYKRYDGKWIPKYGIDDKSGLSPNEALKDFFGPIGDRSNVRRDDPAAARANGWQIQYIHNLMLSDTGLGTYAHEMTHNLDNKSYLATYARRDGVGGESYATGMFEAPVYNSDVLAYNFIYDNTDKEGNVDRLQSVGPQRFKNASDLQEYTKGSLDVLYTLDYAEAVSVLSKPEVEHKKWYSKLENTANGGKYRSLTEAEWANLDLRTVYDLIDNDIMTKRSYPNPNDRNLSRNSYDTVHMFSPIYSALSNDNGVPSNGLMFKLRSYELMAAKGYEDGYIPYASDKLNEEAKASGLPTQTEKYVLDKIFVGKYKTWAEFKKETFKERIDKVDNLKEVTINYEGADVVISDFAKIQELMDKAVDYDIANNTMADSKKSKVIELKSRIYNAYLRMSNDFTNSIYK